MVATRARAAGVVLGVCALVGCGDDGGRETEGSSSSLTQPVTSTMPSTVTETTETSTGTMSGSTVSAGETDSESSGTSTTAGVTCDEESCPEGVCLGGVCCDPDQACGEVCCDAGDVCSFTQCVSPGDTCIDATECPEGNYCEYTLGEPGQMGDGMCQGGFMPATGKCLPEPPLCPDGEEPEEGEEIDCLPECQFIPSGEFNPVLKYHWDLASVMMPPIVIQLDDDNCDDVIDERDIPEIVFMSFANGQYNTNGTLHAISIVDEQIVEKWSVNPQVDRLWAGRALAGGNIDGNPGNEIVACTDGGKVRAFNADGSDLWTSEIVLCDHPSITDLDGDGQVEILVQSAVLDGATGAVELTFPSQGVGTSWWAPKSIAADADGDGELEIVTPTRIFEAQGDLLVDSGLPGTFPAIADFDLDGRPEIVAINNIHGNNIHHLNVWRYDENEPNLYTVVRDGIDINGPLSPSLCPPNSAGRVGGGGPPTIADFNGDGTPDVGVAGGIGYAVFDGNRLIDPNVANEDTILWIEQTQDCSSAFTGSSVFDFDGNGSAEVVYADEHYMRIYAGATGEVLVQECNTSGTLHEYPLVADVDNDGQADIVVASNDYSSLTCPIEQMKTRGVRIFGDADGQWVRTRRIWNQHAYHVTNINEDGSVPAAPDSNWLVPGLNNFRQNVQPEGEFSAPDLVVTPFPRCVGDYALIARVRNLGQAAVPAGVPVGFYQGDPQNGGVLLGTGSTTKVLYPAEAEDVVLELPDPPQEIVSGAEDFWVVVDDGMPDHPWHECRTDNNSAKASGVCNVPG